MTQVNCAGRGADSFPSSLYLPSVASPSLLVQIVSLQGAALGALGVAVAYAGLRYANARCPGSVPASRRDYTALFTAAAVAYNLATDVILGVTIGGEGGSAIAAAAYFSIQALVVVGWSATRVVRFLRDSLAVPLPPPPPPHAASFAAWCARYRTWVAALATLSCLQLSALSLLGSRAAGGVDGPLSAPLDGRLWGAMRFHVTATALVRNVAFLVVICATYDNAGLLRVGVFLKLTASAVVVMYSLVDLAIDRIVSVVARRRVSYHDAFIASPLLAFEGGASGGGDVGGGAEVALGASSPIKLLRGRASGGGGERGPRGGGEPAAGAAGATDHTPKGRELAAANARADALQAELEILRHRLAWATTPGGGSPSQ